MTANPSPQPTITVDRDAAPADTGPLVQLLLALAGEQARQAEPRGSDTEVTVRGKGEER